MIGKPGGPARCYSRPQNQAGGNTTHTESTYRGRPTGILSFCPTLSPLSPPSPTPQPQPHPSVSSPSPWLLYLLRYLHHLFPAGILSDSFGTTSGWTSPCQAVKQATVVKDFNCQGLDCYVNDEGRAMAELLCFIAPGVRWQMQVTLEVAT